MRQATRNELERIRTMFAPLFDGDGSAPRLIIQKGGLPEPLHATLGPDRRIDAWPDESVDAFCERALDAASDAGQDFVVVKGGPLCGRGRDAL